MKKTLDYLKDKKASCEKISMLTCYDYPTAVCMEEAGIDVVFVGDSLGTNVLGYESETEVTMADMEHHLKAVSRGIRNAYLLADLPFMAYPTPEIAVRNAGRLLRLGADAVKLEGPQFDIVKHLAESDIVVWGHLGITPQRQTEKKLQGKTAGAAIELVENALKLERAGASVIVFEVIPEEVARAATEMLSIPTIGIGAGRHTDGQVLIVSDMLGINAFELRHNKKYDDFHSRSVDAFRRYAEEVTAGRFPGKENVRPMKTKEFEEFNEWKSAMK